MAGFIALILNPLVVPLQRWKVRRRGWAVAVVTLWAVLVFVGLAVAFGYPLVNGITHLAEALPSYVKKAEHGKGWIGHLVAQVPRAALGADQHAQAGRLRQGPRATGPEPWARARSRW